MKIEALKAQLGNIPVQDDLASRKRKSRDFYWYSPVLKPHLDGRIADVILQPRNEDELLTLAKAARDNGVPLTLRGGGTGNYGQCVPLAGGAVVEMTGLNRLLWVRDGIARVEAGMNIAELDRQLAEEGWELRMFPSTKRTATIGGFICGGSGGIGSVSWGGLRSPGNVLAARLLSMEQTPTFHELRCDDMRLVNHAFGTTGIVTQLEIPVQPRTDWMQSVIAFDTFRQAAEFAQTVALSPGIQKKLLSVLDAPLTPYMTALDQKDSPLISETGQALVLAVIAPSASDALRTLARNAGGRIFEYGPECLAEQTAGVTPLYEVSWNHTTLQVLKKNRTATYLQCLYPPDRTLDLVDQMRDMFGNELMMHLEFMIVNGRMTCCAIPVIQFTTAERQDRIIALHREAGVTVANPHVFTLEGGSMQSNLWQILMEGKHRFDPQGLLNPGKLGGLPLRTETP